jgi:wyosine [tRNA(Phe)-imidazoG37] synthetase (radical SAM superfamily)
MQTALESTPDPPEIPFSEPGALRRICDGREFLDNRFVYLLFSPRAGGLTVGINLNPDRLCNFDCVYCDVHRNGRSAPRRFDLERMASELHALLDRICSGGLREVDGLRRLPKELLSLKHVALSGEGEPTLCPEFAEAVQSVVHIRATGGLPFFKIVLLSNASVLDQPRVQAGLRHLIVKDEVWLKLDVGTADQFGVVNRSAVPFEHILNNIRSLGRTRPIVIQSLFPLINGTEPSDQFIQDYIDRLRGLQTDGAEISLVQVYSATRPMARSGCRHLPLKSLSRIAHEVRDQTGLRVEVF